MSSVGGLGPSAGAHAQLNQSIHVVEKALHQQKLEGAAAVALIDSVEQVEHHGESQPVVGDGHHVDVLA